MATWQETVNGWLDEAPTQMRIAFNTDPFVHRSLIECAKKGLTTEQMLWCLSSELWRSQQHWRDEVVRIIERSALPPVQLS